MNMELLFKTAYTLDRWKIRCESSKTRENKEFSAFSKSRNLERFKQQKGLLRFFLYCFNVCFQEFCSSFQASTGPTVSTWFLFNT